MTGALTKDEIHHALEIVIDIAARWGENTEEGFARRVLAEDDDATCEKLADDSMVEVEDVTELRNLWRAIEALNKEFFV